MSNSHLAADGPQSGGHADTRGHRAVSVVGAAVVDRLEAPTRLLAARRATTKSPQGWEFPGGKVEPGESWEQALHREVDEELGVTLRLGRWLPGPLPDGRWPLPGGFVIAVALAQIRTGTPALRGSHDALRWLRRHELYDVAWLPGDLPVVAALAEHLRAT